MFLFQSISPPCYIIWFTISVVKILHKIGDKIVVNCNIIILTFKITLNLYYLGIQPAGISEIIIGKHGKPIEMVEDPRETLKINEIAARRKEKSNNSKRIQYVFSLNYS